MAGYHQLAQTVIRTLPASLLILFASMAYAETIYKFVDEQGNIQYSADPPPEGGNFKTLDKMPEPNFGYRAPMTSSKATGIQP
jgi:hypothetical protein